MTQVEAHRHLFIDDYEIDSMSGLSRSLLGATLYEGNPVIHNDYPWERYVIKSGGTYLLQDPNDGLFKLYYLVIPRIVTATADHVNQVAVRPSGPGAVRVECAVEGSPDPWKARPLALPRAKVANNGIQCRIASPRRSHRSPNRVHERTFRQVSGNGTASFGVLSTHGAATQRRDARIRRIWGHIGGPVPLEATGLGSYCPAFGNTAPKTVPRAAPNGIPIPIQTGF